MNLSNLEDRQYEMKELGFSKESTEKMQELMEKNVPEFKLYESKQTPKGMVDYRLHYKKSAQSDFYYFNKFDVTVDRNKLRTPESKYMVITPTEGDKSLVRKFETPYEAIEYFKQQPNSELAIGKDVRSRTKLAQIENSKMIYTERSFRQTFSQPPLPQTFYIDSGKGFSKEQAGNLMLGNAVYRDDLLNFQGVGYQAWVMLNFNKERDRYGNFPMNQYNDPAYGFDLNETLEKFRIKEMETPEGTKKLEESVRNGNTPLVTVQNQDNETQKVRLEVAVRFRNINFFREDGKPVMREQFLKEGQDLLQARTNTMGLGQNQNEARTARMAR
ncbi:hypothetical protein [Sphingobacterium psychroaquaticum]|uniref:DUF3945 domain-containing protein n=1 Tax=Sphingobacterium psychroaquaticum TaxID=561061 RepID=A0A1X7IL47_9SPHI|nr:hypothetical protein [Sphingobacterium psychroaquaticum]SMG15650.1 hypothetical protein SAMN05660862_0981 [Sphingobacterium psychroaquaticum]